jgi:hypothetical protein
MARVAGCGGSVIVASQVIEDCEDAWNEQAGTGVTASADTTDFKVGSGSAKFVCDATTGLEIVASEVVVSMNLSSYTDLLFWAKSSVGLDAGDWQLLLDDTGSCASPIVTADIPALTADTWKFCRVSATLTSCTAIISVGLQQAVDKGAMTFRIDSVWAGKAAGGIKSWTLDRGVATYESTGFDSSGVKTFLPGVAEWSGSFEGFKEGAPLSIGSVVGLELRESSTSTQQWRGIAIITGVHASVPTDGLVTYSYDFQGTDALELATA